MNVKGVFFCTQAGAHPWYAQAGRRQVIVNMDSIAALIGLEDRFAYSMTKGAVLAMTRCTAVDYVKKKHPLQLHLPRARAQNIASFVDGFLKRDYPGKEAEMFGRNSPITSPSAAWPNPRRLPIWRFTWLPTRLPSLLDRPTRLMGGC